MTMRRRFPLLWSYHRNTMRWGHNLLTVAEGAAVASPFKEYAGARRVELPRPAWPAAELSAAVRGRLSCRRFSGDDLDREQLSLLLQAGYGVGGRCLVGSEELLERPVPSGGGLYPLELYLLALRIRGLTSGVYHYAPIGHALEGVRELELPDPFLAQLFLGQPYLAGSAGIVVQTAVLERSTQKYEERAYRYVLLEAGHVAQNLNLVAIALGLGSLNLGGFFDADLARLLGVELDEEVPLYATAVGVPQVAGRAEQRGPVS